MSEKQRLEKVIELLGCDVDIQEIPEDAYRPLLDTLSCELHTIVADF